MREISKRDKFCFRLFSFLRPKRDRKKWGCSLHASVIGYFHFHFCSPQDFNMAKKEHKNLVAANRRKRKIISLQCSSWVAKRRVTLTTSFVKVWRFFASMSSSRQRHRPPTAAAHFVNIHIKFMFILLLQWSTGSLYATAADCEWARHRSASQG